MKKKKRLFEFGYRIRIFELNANIRIFVDILILKILVLQGTNMYHGAFFLISSLGPWTLYDRDHSDFSTDRTTLCSVSQGLGTTGPRGITQRALSSWIMS